MTHTTPVRDGSRDFDFLYGTWDVHHRRLAERLKGSTTWEEFDAPMTARPTLGGRGNFDETSMERASGRVEGMTVRFYNPASGEWTIYWADSINGFGSLPMVGKFDGNGRGLLYAHEPFNGRYIFVRFIWTVLASDKARWEQAFSEDGGTTWETNWEMDFTKRT